jgi:hypothetical protein
VGYSNHTGLGKTSTCVSEEGWGVWGGGREGGREGERDTHTCKALATHVHCVAIPLRVSQSKSVVALS